MDREQTNSYPIEETKMPTNRFSLIVALGAIAVLAILTVSMIAAPHTASATSSNDQIELVRAQRYAAAAAQQAYLDQRRGEWNAGITADNSYDRIELLRAENYRAAAAEQAYLAQRQGEWNAGAASDNSYDVIELERAQRYAAATAQQAYLNYRRGEWTGK